MSLNEPANWPGDSAEKGPVKWGQDVVNWFRGTMAVLEMDVRKVMHDPTELVTRTLQPVLWLFVFGGAFGRFRALPTGDVPYQAFLIPGVLAQSMLFISIFFGLSIIWERDLGLLQKLLALPLPRNVFVLGKALAAGFRSLTQVVVILVLAALVGIPLHWGLVNLVAVVMTIVLGSILFSSFSMILAALLKTRERFMGLGQLFTMPLFFASNALYPIEIMPAWLRVLAKANPLTYIVDLMRSLLISGDLSNCVTDLTVLVLTMLVLLVIATRVYPRAAY